MTEKAFNRLTVSVMGFVTAGLIGTSEGAAFAFQMRLLSMEVAGVFLPTFYKVLDALNRVVAWFRSLSGEQQNQIRLWVEKTVVVTAFLAIGAKLITFVKTLSLALAQLTVSTGIGVILLAVGAIIVAFQAWKNSGDGVFSTFMKIYEALKPIIKAVGEVIAKLMDVLRPVIERVADVAVKAFERLTPSLIKLAEMIGNVAEMALEILAPHFDTAMQLITIAIMGVVSALETMLSVIGFVIDSVRDLAAWFGVLDENTAQRKERLEREEEERKSRSLLTDKKGQERTTPTFSGGTFSNVADTFKRIQSTISKIDYQAKIADYTKRTAEAVEQLASGAGASWGPDPVGP